MSGALKFSQGMITMDYSKSGYPKRDKNTPRLQGHKAKGAPGSPKAQRLTKEELLARMKAAAEAKKAPEAE